MIAQRTDLQGRVALVTGGAHRVGRAIALALAGAGASIALHYHRSHEEAAATLADIAAAGVEAAPISADLAQVAEAERTIDAVVERWGRLDILVCSAGIFGRMPLGSVTEAEWDALFALNTRAPFFLAQRAAPHLRSSKGCIVNITEIGMEKTWKAYTPYLSSKAALAMLTRNLARDLAPDVRVNAIAPGPVLLPDDWGEEQQARVASRTLAGRLGSADDVAQAVLYLVAAEYVTGVVLPVDGGYQLK
jgi:pteridine reductase